VPGTVETIGDFEVLREIGRGGMGVVYEARQLSLNRRVALKVLPGIGRSSNEAVERFRREAASAARLTHPNIIQVYAFGESAGHHFIAMEFVDGPSLERVLSGGGKCPERIDTRDSTWALSTDGDRTLPLNKPLVAPPAVVAPPASKCGEHAAMKRADLDRYLRILIDTSRALHAAHEVGVLHRDIKPANILLDSDGRVKLADFGLARNEAAGDTVTASGELLGTLAYMSPEQVAPKRVPITRRADVYALGVTLYEVLTGRRPFEHATAQVVMHLIQTTDPTGPRKIDPTVPKDLEVICLKAIEKDPERRYATALELAEDLERYLRDEPILAKPSSTVTKLIRFVRRRKIPLIATTLLVTSAIVIIALLQRDRAKTLEWNKQVARQKVEFSLMRTLGGQKAEVLAMLDEAERLDPTLVDLYLQRGLLYFNLDQPEKALLDLDRGLAREPNDAVLLFARGTVLRFIGREAEGAASIEKAQLDTVEDALRLTALGIFQTTNGLARDAIDTLELAKKANSKWPQSRFGLALAYFRLRRFDKAETMLRSFLDLDPKHPVGQALLVTLDVLRAPSAIGEFQTTLVNDAYEQLAVLKELAPDEPLTAAVTASVTALLPDEDGRAALERALDRVDDLLKTTSAEKLRISGAIVYEVLAQLAMPIDAARAKQYASEALRIRPKLDGARIVLADLEARAGRVDDALAQYRKIVDDYPQTPLAQGRILAIRLKDPAKVADDETGRLVTGILAAAPEDEALLTTAAAAAASLPTLKAESQALYKLAWRVYRARGNDAKAAEIAEILARG
jgi:serine/threonine protein kinase/Tfp pilus assembly protein PilF